MGKSLKIAGATVNQIPINWAHNIDNITKAIKEAQNENIDLLCFPELSITGYGCEDLFLSDWVSKRALIQLEAIVKLCENITVCVGLPVNHNGKTYNSTAVIKNQQLLGITAKQNLAIDGVHYEFRWFTPWPKNTIETIVFNGNEYPFGDVLYSIDNVKIGFEICEDAWIEDRPACRLIEKGVELIINPSASHFAFGKSEDRENLVVKSSQKFKCTYLYVNLSGNEAGRMIYDGEILIAQKGCLLAKNELLSFQNFKLLSSTIRFEEDISEHRGEPAHSKNEEFARAVSLGLYDYLRKSKSKGFVLSLSGGADSSTCAVLVAHLVKIGVSTLGVGAFLKEIGREDIEIEEGVGQTTTVKTVIAKLLTCAYQQSKNSSSTTLLAAKTLAESIGATFYHWQIDEALTSYTKTIESALGRKLNWRNDDLALQNIQARSRSPIIWMLANIENKLLITTSNRSESDVGYATMDGDTSGSIAPISAVDKVFIRQWLLWAEKSLGYLGLNDVNKLAPTAELRPSGEEQTDEDDLMPYSILLEIEKLAIGLRQNPIEVYHNLNGSELTSPELLKEYIIKFFQLWSRNQWKRERIAPAFHLDTFNVDPKTWCRFPILSGSFEEEITELRTM